MNFTPGVSVVRETSYQAIFAGKNSAKRSS
jgi:hypothetical protein